MVTEDSEKELSKQQKKGAPPWATQPFKQFLEQEERLRELLQISVRGISMLRGVPSMFEALSKVNESNDKITLDRINRAKKEADLATQEINEGFPLLHAQTLIALWSALEATVRLFLARWLQNHKQAWEIEQVKKLRIRLGDYERLEGEDRFFYILDQLEQELSSPLKTGVTRFEILLKPFGLSGSVNEKLRRDLFELNQIRNVLVHRSGIVDRRFVEACPWLGLRAGDKLRVNADTTRRHFESVAQYVLELIVRLGEHFGTDMSQFRTKSELQEVPPVEAEN